MRGEHLQRLYQSGKKQQHPSFNLWACRRSIDPLQQQHLVPILFSHWKKVIFYYVFPTNSVYIYSRKHATICNYHFFSFLLQNLLLTTPSPSALWPKMRPGFFSRKKLENNNTQPKWKKSTLVSENELVHRDSSAQIEFSENESSPLSLEQLPSLPPKFCCQNIHLTFFLASLQVCSSKKLLNYSIRFFAATELYLLFCVYMAL